MKNNKNLALLFLAVIVIWAGILYWRNYKDPIENLISENNEEINIENNPDILEPEPFKIQMCFIYNAESGDKANIIMNINGEKVDGEFNWLPAEKDKKTGNFSGTIGKVDPYMMARMLDVWWDANAEGTIVKEELKIIMGEGTATVGFGSMEDRGDGVYIYSDPENISYSLPLSLTSCDDEFLR